MLLQGAAHSCPWMHRHATTARSLTAGAAADEPSAETQSKRGKGQQQQGQRQYQNFFTNSSVQTSATGVRHTAHRSDDWETSEPRRGARASSSSKKRRHGAAARARANSCRTALSLSPTHLFSSSGPCTHAKYVHRMLQSAASKHARAASIAQPATVVTHRLCHQTVVHAQGRH